MTEASYHGSLRWLPGELLNFADSVGGKGAQDD